MQTAARKPSRRPGASTVAGGLVGLAACAVCAWFGYVSGRSAAVATANGVPLAPAAPALAAAAAAVAAAASSASAAAAAAPEPAPRLAALAPAPAPACPSCAACAPATRAAERARLSAAHRRLASRGELPSLLRELGLSGEGAEVGVRDGEFALWTLKHSELSLLHLVDPWKAQDKQVYNDVSNVRQEEHDARHNDVVAAMHAAHPGRFKVHRTYSVDAARSFNDGSLDYVYLDARHDYAGVAEDLVAWWPKLARGGVLAGHDFVPDGEHEAGSFGVQRAVAEFAARERREVQVIASKRLDGGREEPQHVDGGWTTFWLIK